MRRVKVLRLIKHQSSGGAGKLRRGGGLLRIKWNFHLNYTFILARLGQIILTLILYSHGADRPLIEVKGHTKDFKHK